jgi:hypothetical protein
LVNLLNLKELKGATRWDRNHNLACRNIVEFSFGFSGDRSDADLCPFASAERGSAPPMSVGSLKKGTPHKIEEGLSI